MLCSIASMGQVKFFNGTLAEAFAEGREKNEQVLLLLTMPTG